MAYRSMRQLEEELVRLEEELEAARSLECAAERHAREDMPRQRQSWRRDRRRSST